MHRADIEAAALIHQLIVTAARTQPDRTRDRDLTDRLWSEACSPLTVADHAKNLGVTVRALREAAHRDTGSNPKEILLQARISQAKELLAHTDMLVAQVAHEVGYDDPAYFCRIFSRLVGSSPTVFRRRQARSIPEQLRRAGVEDIDRG